MGLDSYDQTKKLPQFCTEDTKAARQTLAPELDLTQNVGVSSFASILEKQNAGMCPSAAFYRFFNWLKIILRMAGSDRVVCKKDKRVFTKSQAIPKEEKTVFQSKRLHVRVALRSDQSREAEWFLLSAKQR